VKQHEVNSGLGSLLGWSWGSIDVLGSLVHKI